MASAVFDVVGGLKAVPRWLAEQTCRAAVSVPANIVEGYSRGSLGDYLRCLDIARGSLGETEYYIEFLKKKGIIAGSAFETLSPLVEETGSMLFALIKSLEKKRAAGTWTRHYAIKEEQEVYQERGKGNEERGIGMEEQVRVSER